MKYYILFLVVSFLSVCCNAQNTIVFNGSMERLDANRNPVGWTSGITPEQKKSYLVTIDSLTAIEGKYSLSIQKRSEDASFGVATFVIPHTFRGQSIELKGYIRTEEVRGFAGMWLRIDGADSHIAFDNMQNRNLNGTREWKEYSIKLPYSEQQAKRIVLGGLLVGSGKMWLDNLRLYIDGTLIDQAPVATPPKLTKAQTDTVFAARSGIDTVLFNQQTKTNLILLGQIWGFLKYHHPAIAAGSYNMDAELFRVMPAVIRAKDNKELSDVLEKWTDRFGTPPRCKKCRVVESRKVAHKPDYGSMFNPELLSPSLLAKLKYILSNRNRGNNYYIETAASVGNPIFSHEVPYASMSYPDAGFRILCLYRYWNMIQYFYPYKHLIGHDWNNTLAEFIPRFVNSASRLEYTLTSLALISSINDTHANIWSSQVLESYRGMYAAPFQARFIENKLVVTGYYTDTLNVKEKVKRGDVITKINGVTVEQLIKKFLPITAASNYETQLRDMPRSYLLRSNKPSLSIEIVSDGERKFVDISNVRPSDLNANIDYDLDPKATAFKLIDNGIGYLFPGRYKNTTLPEIERVFDGSNGIIVDMRCYPSDFMLFTFVPYVKSGNADFVKFTTGDVSNPGLFTMSAPLSNRGRGIYRKKVVVIVNEQTQSQAEYTTMAFQSSPNVIVIGSTTAGADGNVSAITLPGGIRTMISGIGILYPDGTETQRKGVKIDRILKPSINGVKSGRDELLEKAIEIIKKGG